MATDSGAITAATMTIGQTVVVYTYFLPPLREVRQATDTTTRNDLYLGQFAAAAVSTSVGVMLTWLTGSFVPLYTTVFIALVIAGIYQYAMNNGRKENEA